jgi:hypothetical protein
MTTKYSGGFKMPDQPELYRLGKTRKETDFDVEYTPDFGVKGLNPPSFVRGVSHVGLQIFLTKNIVDNPTISTSYKVFAEATKKTATISTVYEVTVV